MRGSAELDLRGKFDYTCVCFVREQTGGSKRGLLNFVNYDNAAVVAVSDIDIKKMAYFTETFQKQLIRKKKSSQQLNEIKSFTVRNKIYYVIWSNASRK